MINSHASKFEIYNGIYISNMLMIIIISYLNRSLFNLHMFILGDMFMSYESKQEFIMATGPDHKEEIRNLNPHELLEKFINDVDMFDFLFDISTKDDELYELSTLFLKDDKYTTKMIMNVDDCGLLRVIKVVITNGKTCTLTDLSYIQALNIYMGLHFAITVLSHFSHAQDVHISKFC